MTAFSSLTNRIFFATALLAVLSIAVAIYIVNVGVTRQAEVELRQGLDEAGTLVNEYRSLLFEHFTTEARLVADLPRLKAAVDTDDPLTVKPIAEDYQQLLKPDLFIVTGRHGVVLAQIGTEENGLTATAAVQEAAHGQESTWFWPARHGLLQVISVPIGTRTDPHQPDILGTLSIGISLDQRAAARFKALTDSEIAFGANGRIQAATLPAAMWPQLARLLDRPGLTPRAAVDGNEYIAMTQALPSGGAAGQPVAIILRSRTERLRFLGGLHTLLGATALVAVLAATLLSYGIARTVTRPLGAITSTMRQMAATGDLTPRIPVVVDDRWQDEDARLLATTFNTMTDSIDRFQREAAQRERLSALGRLSTVVAHEVRNPLMIIKAALRGLRREDAGPAQVQAAVHDIDEEITRLNRIVAEVLDFARPIKFDLAPADLNALAEDAVRAASAGASPAPIRTDLDRSLPQAVTDAERLRLALVNVLGNAIQAVEARASAPGARARDGDDIHISTARLDGQRVAIVVRDRGTGIAPDDLPRVFDPYFTSRRTGTGIGLAITRNIIEGLGGRITVTSERERGTEVRIELPLHPATA